MKLMKQAEVPASHPSNLPSPCPDQLGDDEFWEHLRPAVGEIVDDLPEAPGPGIEISDILAYNRGKLSRQEEERVREHLLRDKKAVEVLLLDRVLQPQPASFWGYAKAASVILPVLALGILLSLYGASPPAKGLGLAENRYDVILSSEGGSRADDVGAEIEYIPAGAARVGFKFLLTSTDARAHSEFRVRVVHEGRDQPWSLDKLRALDKELTFSIPVGQLEQGTYELSLFGVREDGGETAISSQARELRFEDPAAEHLLNG